MENVMQMKADIMAVTTSPGWHRVCRVAEHVINDLVRQSVQEPDDAVANGIRRDARGAQQFWTDLLKRLDMMKNLDDPTNNDFVDIDTGEEML